MNAAGYAAAYAYTLTPPPSAADDLSSLSTVTACVSYLADQCPQSSTGVASMQAAGASFETGYVSRTGVVPAGPTTMLPHWADLMTRVAQSVSTHGPRWKGGFGALFSQTKRRNHAMISIENHMRSVSSFAAFAIHNT